MALQSLTTWTVATMYILRDSCQAIWLFWVCHANVLWVEFHAIHVVRYSCHPSLPLSTFETSIVLLGFGLESSSTTRGSVGSDASSAALLDEGPSLSANLADTDVGAVPVVDALVAT